MGRKTDKIELPWVCYIIIAYPRCKSKEEYAVKDTFGKSGAYAMYLRKSRADMEAELRGEGETLARHRNALTQLAARRGLNVVKIYEEIGSADTIAGRPQMQALLADVEAGKYAGVIVNDADRLARGDGIDQGIVKQAFYSTGTLIVTPLKTFDPADDADEDFFDFSLFMARFEYRKIKQRMQTGRARSAAEGNYLGTRVTYGYNKVKRTDRRGWTLEPDPEKAEIVRMIFHWYAYGDNGEVLGADKIARRLNAMGLRTDLGRLFDGGRIRCMLRNPSYIGVSSWNKKTRQVKSVDGTRIATRQKNPDPIIVENAHEAIIDRALWDKVQGMFETHAKLPKNTDSPVSNVLSGLVKCALCGKALQRKPGVGGRPDILHCKTYGCPTTGIYIPTLEQTLLNVLKDWVVEYSHAERTTTPKTDSPAPAIQRQIDTLNGQLARLHDLLEQGIYTPAVFVQRRDELNARIAAATAELERIKHTPTTEETIIMQLPQINHVLDAYPLTDDIRQKNALLRSVIARVDYHKTKRCTRADNPADYMELDIYPLLPPK